jgi:serine/threonine protein kinase
VIKIFEVFETERSILIVTEFLGGGDMLQYLKAKKRFDEHTAKRFMRQIIEGVAACHKLKILHRDIKLDNILLDAEHSRLKLCDFGVSRTMHSGQVVAE